MFAESFGIALIFFFLILRHIFLHSNFHWLILPFSELASLQIHWTTLRLTLFLPDRILSWNICYFFLTIHLFWHYLNAEILLEGSVVIKYEFLHNAINFILLIVIMILISNKMSLFLKHLVLIQYLLFYFVHELLVNLPIMVGRELPILTKLLKYIDAQLVWLLLLDYHRWYLIQLGQWQFVFLIMLLIPNFANQICNENMSLAQLAKGSVLLFVKWLLL